jgi:hypothetical protein
MWDQMRDPDAPPAVLSKKCKKWGIVYQPYGLTAIQQKVTRDYLVQSSTHAVDDEALTVGAGAPGWE